MNQLKTKATMTELAQRLEAALETMPQVDCPIRHYFAPGLYARETTLPKGTVIVGAVHKTENLVVLSKGRILLATEDGPIEVSAPKTVTLKAGSKNSVTALEDSVWTNILANPTDEKDIDKLVEIFTESKASELLGGSENKQLLANKLKELES